MHIKWIGDRLKIYITKADMLNRGVAPTDAIPFYFYLDKGGLVDFPKKLDKHKFKTTLGDRAFFELTDEVIALAKSQYHQFDFRPMKHYAKNPRKLSQGEAIRTYKTKQLKGFKKNPETTKEDIVLQEKRGQSWFTMATFNKIQKEFAVQLGKHLHRKYPNKAFRILG